ncbi:MAG: winged helix-turn-helix domain-containing protein [Methanolobus sp.]|nr:winged helix-turn-helix domain-containing protein [Methanolobus sp.]
MKKSLLDVIFASDKRKNVLLMLQDGHKEMEFILESLETTRQALLPQMRILEEHHLIAQRDDSYELTRIGGVVVKEMNPLLDIIDIFDNDIEYWGTRKLDSIPLHLLERINELGKCSIINPSLQDIYDIPSEIYAAIQGTHETVNKFNEASVISKYYCGLTTFLYPNIDTILFELLESNVDVNLIISKNLLDKIRTDFHISFTKLLEDPLFHFYVLTKETGFLSCAYTNHYFLMRLLNNKGEYDNKYILCSSPEAIQWGKELFEYYLKYSVPVTEL